MPQKTPKPEGPPSRPECPEMSWQRGFYPVFRGFGGNPPKSGPRTGPGPGPPPKPINPAIRHFLAQRSKRPQNVYIIYIRCFDVFLRHKNIKTIKFYKFYIYVYTHKKHIKLYIFICIIVYVYGYVGGICIHIQSMRCRCVDLWVIYRVYRVGALEICPR